MRIFTLSFLMVLFSITIVFAQATSNRTTGVASTTPIVDKEKPASSNPRADIYSIDFESELEWTFDFTPWTVNDVDLLPTYGFTNYDFPHEFEAMAYIVFNPSTTTPPATDDSALQPHSGMQFGACIASVPSGGQGNDDWFISDLIEIGTDPGPSFTFWAKSYTDTYGLERFNVAVSTTGTDPGDFTIISGDPYVEAPIVWTEFSYDLSAYAGQSIHVAIQCVSYDAFVFMIDDLVVFPAQAAPDCDNFDTYTAGQLLCPQSGGLWTTWDDNPGGQYDGYVSNAEFLSSPNSLSVDKSVLESDLVRNLYQTVTGRWDISMDILVPDSGGTYGGYYNIMQDMVLYGSANEWGFQVYFGSDGNGYMQDAAFNQTDFTYTVGEWFHSSVIVDVDSAWAEFYLNGTLINGWQWDIDGPDMLGVIDIYAAAPAGDAPKFYVDNVCFELLAPVGIDPVAADKPGILVFPNPVNSFLNITSADRLLEVQIFNTTGQTVYSGTVSGNSVQVNTQNFESGLYVIRIKSENGYEMKKFMKD